MNHVYIGTFLPCLFCPLLSPLDLTMLQRPVSACETFLDPLPKKLIQAQILPWHLSDTWIYTPRFFFLLFNQIVNLRKPKCLVTRGLLWPGGHCPINGFCGGGCDTCRGVFRVIHLQPSSSLVHATLARTFLLEFLRLHPLSHNCKCEIIKWKNKTLSQYYYFKVCHIFLYNFQLKKYYLLILDIYNNFIT